MRTQAIWFTGTKTEEDKEKVKQDLALAFRAFQRLEKLLKTKLKEPSSDYAEPSWAYHQADTIGYNRAIREVMKLIQTTEK